MMRKYRITLLGVLFLMFLDTQARDLAIMGPDNSDGKTDRSTTVSAMSTEQQRQLPDRFAVRQNYPNPFNATTTIEYDLPECAGVYSVVYDIRGHRIKTLKNDLQKAGSHKLKWDGATSSGEEAASGVYFYVLLADDYYSTGKMLLVK